MGCPELTVPGTAYCLEHAIPVPNTWDTSTNKKPGNWDSLRSWAMFHSRGKCVFCGRRATEVDHLLPMAWGGHHGKTNIRAVCAKCHRAKTNDEARLGKRMKTMEPGEKRAAISAFVHNWEA